MLTTALQIHSVEARHAARIRFLRAQVNGVGQKPYITNSETGGLPAAIYAGDDNVMQGGVDITTLVSGMGISRAAVTESFDEPLTREQVLAIAGPFIVS